MNFLKRGDFVALQSGLRNIPRDVIHIELST